MVQKSAMFPGIGRCGADRDSAPRPGWSWVLGTGSTDRNPIRSGGQLENIGFRTFAFVKERNLIQGVAKTVPRTCRSPSAWSARMRNDAQAGGDGKQPIE